MCTYFKTNQWDFSTKSILKMLGLYLYSLIIGHKSCNVLSMLNKLSLQRELQNVVTKYVFMDKN